MFLKQVLHANLDGYTFTAFKSKNFYLVRKTIKRITWEQHTTFDEVLRALSWFELSVQIEKESKDDGIPF